MDAESWSCNAIYAGCNSNGVGDGVIAVTSPVNGVGYLVGNIINSFSPMYQ